MLDIDRVREALLRKRPVERITHFLSSGSTLLNLACTGRVKGCFRSGHYYFFVGDSQSGKTFLALTCLAEATISKHFQDYRLIYDNAEDGALMDMERFFGEKLANRLEAPSKYDNGDSCYSRTIEDFYFHVDDAVKEGKPFIYILDSMDALSSEYEREKFQKVKRARRREEEISGSMGDGKAKINSSGIRQSLAKLKDTDSILIIICQTRDAFQTGFAVGFGPKEKTRAGGHALKFYATLEIWSSIKGAIKKVVKGKKRKIGIYSKVQVKKNREEGKDRTVIVPIYNSVGIDDLGSCIQYLIEEKHWKGSEAKVRAPEFDWEGTQDGLIKKVEEEGRESELRNLVAAVWKEIEDACSIERKPRYV